MSEALNHLAERVGSDPLFLANALAEYARSETLDDAAIAAALGCSADDLTRIRLCRVPRTDPEQFRTDIAAVAARFGINATKLAEIVRRGQSLTRFRQARSATSEAGFLLAARDDDRNPPPPTEEETP